MKLLFVINPHSFRLSNDLNRVVEECKSCFDGGGVHIPMPYAKPDDGILNITLTGAISKLNLVKVIGDRNKGHFEKRKAFRHIRARSLQLKSDIPIRVQMDGESFYTHELKLEIVPNAIKFAAPEGRTPADYSRLAYKALG